MPTPEAAIQVASQEPEWEGRGWFPPGPQLAACLPGHDRLTDLTDAELIEVMAAARRQTAWAQSRELAAIAELSARRQAADADRATDDYRRLSAHESLIEEISCAVSVTGNTAATLLHLADRLANSLPGTRAALQAGLIDLPRARVLCEATDDLPNPVCEQVEAALLPHAEGRTTGQLRRRAKTLVRKLAPEFVEEQRQASIADRRVEYWESAKGTATLALLDVPATHAHAVHLKLTAAAQTIRADGDPRSHDQIRTDLAMTLLRGHTLPEAIRSQLTEPAPETGPAEAAAGPGDAADQVLDPSPGIGGGSTRPGGSHRPARRAADTAERALPVALAAELDQRLVGLRGHLRAAGRLPELPEQAAHLIEDVHRRLTAHRDTWCQTARQGGGQDGQRNGGRGTETSTPHGHRGYRPPAALREVIEQRHPTCVFPTCNQPSRRCDLDHTIAFDAHGPTCGCNLAALCRRHHRTKQTRGWRLFQPWPGLLIWITPTGTWHITLPSRE